MGFLDKEGLSYFYSKIKNKFIRSVNAKTPDETGNVNITNVATADNLTSPDAQSSYDYFIYRTSGGSASLSSGEAQLVYINGNMKIDGRIPENFIIRTENNIEATYNINIWKNKITESGRYTFQYIKPASETNTSEWTQDGIWKNNGKEINLSGYGIYVNGIVNPYVFINASNTDLIPLINPNTWFNNILESDIYFEKHYTFIYDVPDSDQDLTESGEWKYEGESINLSDYGITLSGDPQKDDIITVTSTVGTPNSTITVDYTKYDPGTITIPTPTKFSATGFNQFDKKTMKLSNATITTISGNRKKIVSGSHIIAYCRAKGGVSNGYVAYSENNNIVRIGWCAEEPKIDSIVDTTNAEVTTSLASIPFDDDGYVVVEVTNVNDLCIHPQWSGAANTDKADYVAPSEINLPTEDIEGVSIPIGTWGMPAVGAVFDQLNLDAGVYVQRINRLENTSSNLSEVQNMGTPYEYDDNYIYYVLLNPVTYIVDVDPTYIVNDWGTEEFVGTTVALGAQTLYGQNLRDKLRTDVLTISQQTPPLNEAQTKQVYENLGLHSFHLSSTITSLPLVINDERITKFSSVTNVVFGTPSAIIGDLSWKTESGKVTFEGTLAPSGSTTVEFDIAPTLTAAGYIPDPITLEDPVPISRGGTNATNAVDAVRNLGLTFDSGANYCKLPDGTLIQWGTISVGPVNVDTAWGSGYESAEISITGQTFQVPFISTPTLFLRLRVSPVAFLEDQINASATGMSGTFHLARPSIGHNCTGSIFWLAIGRWK